MRRIGIRHVRAAPQTSGYTPLWPPTKLSSAVAWVDCQETLTQAGTVTSIRNMVSGVDWTEATNPPTFNATAINGMPCMVGNGSNMKIMSTEAAVADAFSGVEKAWTSIIVMAPVANNRTVVGFGNSGNNTPRGSCLSLTTARPTVSKVGDPDTPNIDVLGSVDVPLARASVITTICYGAQTSLIVNLGRPSAPAFQGVGQMTIDRIGLLCRPRQTPDSFSFARIGAALVFQKALPLSEVYGLVSALMWRWRFPSTP